MRIALVFALLAALPAAAKVKVGDVRAAHAQSPHPYPVGADHRPVVWTDTVRSPGAEFVRVHFSSLDLAEGDFVTVASPDGGQSWTYFGKGPQGTGEFWAFAIDGDTAIVDLHGGGTRGHGYAIDAVGHGTQKLGASPTPEVVCGTDGREDVACHLPETDAAQKPVARLLFTSRGSQFLCTGWLVAGSIANTMLTNNHCFKTQKEVNTVQAMFNFQRTACGGSTNATATSYNGGTFLRTNSLDRKGSKGGLDYTIFTLQGSPASVWGVLVATTKAVAVGDLIWFVQHPAGGVKKIGYWEDSSQTARCKVDATNQTYGRSAPNSQTAYGCDSEGGSSGSPIVDAFTGHVISLHHFGGVGACLNGGTAMAAICSDAGALLSCVSD